MKFKKKYEFFRDWKKTFQILDADGIDISSTGFGFSPSNGGTGGLKAASAGIATTHLSVRCIVGGDFLETWLEKNPLPAKIGFSHAPGACQEFTLEDLFE